MEQQKLPSVSTAPSKRPPRPSQHNRELLVQVAAAICKQLGETIPEEILEQARNPDTDIKDLDDSSALCSLYEVLNDEYDWSSYKLARRLDARFGWDIDDETLDALSNAAMYAHSIYEKQVREWIKQYEITPKYAVGDRVMVRVKNEDRIGCVITVRDTLDYTVEIAELGHGVKQADGCVIYGLIFNEEDIKPA